MATKYILMPVSGASMKRKSNPFAYEMLSNLAHNLSFNLTGGIVGAAANVNPASIRHSIKNFPGNRKLPDNKTTFKVLDSVNENGAKLIESDVPPAQLRFDMPEMRIIPNTLFSMARIEPKSIIHPAAIQKSIGTEISVMDEKMKPVVRVKVVAYTDYEKKNGDEGYTDKKGKLILKLKPGTKIERMYIYPFNRCWPTLIPNLTLEAGKIIKLKNIDDNHIDSFRFFYKTSNKQKFPVVPANAKLKIAVIDSGIYKHADLNIQGGRNLVTGGDPNDYNDTFGHGTHVAGIIGGNGSFRGILPNVKLRAYQVYPKNSERAEAFALIKAIARAVEDGCHLINLSLTSNENNESVMSTIREAYENGVLCIAAAGNDDRNPVAFPASYSLCVSVSALGRTGTFPKSALQKDFVKAPKGKDKNNFFASFSNFGQEIDVIAPGVGIISTMPGGEYGIMDGTSMACPIVTGICGRYLLDHPEVLKMPANQQRSNAMISLINGGFQSLGFKPFYQGQGILV